MVSPPNVNGSRLQPFPHSRVATTGMNIAERLNRAYYGTPGSQCRRQRVLRIPQQLLCFRDRPESSAAAVIAFCVTAFADGMTEDSIEPALEDGYLSHSGVV